jgi:excisionase family DNA binding protein
MDEQDKMLDTGEAADLLGVSQPTFFRLVKKYGIISYSLTGTKSYYRREDLEKIKQDRQTFKPKNPVARLAS